MVDRCAIGGVLISVGLLACGDETQSTDGFTETKKLVLMAGPDLASCRVEKGTDSDPFFRVDQVICKLAPKTDFPLQASRVHVSVGTANGHAGDADLAADETVVASVNADAYPLDLEIGATYSMSDAGPLVGLGSSGFFQGFSARHTVVAPTTDTLSARFPFDLWPVEVRATKADFSGALDPFVLDLSPMKTSSGAATLDVQAGLGTISQGGKRYSLIPVTRGTKLLPGKGKIADKDVTFEITGPGAYVVEPEGLRGATEADLEDVSGGPTFATCWTAPAADPQLVDVFGRREAVPGLAFATLETLIGEDPDSASAGPSLEAGDTKIATVAASDLPLALWGRATLQSPDVVGIAPWQAEGPITVPVAVSADASAAAPASLHLPFDVWPITVDAQGGSFVCDLDPYSVPLGVAWAGVALIKVEGQATPWLNEGDNVTFYVVADSRAQSLPCRGLIVTNGGDVTENVEVSLVRNGRYRVGPKTVDKES